LKPVRDPFTPYSTPILLTPRLSESTRRCAIRPFSLSDGTKINVGEWATTPTAAMLQSAAFYPKPLHFSGFRFVPQELLDGLDESNTDDTELKTKPRQPSPSRFVDIDGSWYVWGAGRQTW
jgi:hypothetical protein